MGPTDKMQSFSVNMWCVSFDWFKDNFKRGCVVLFLSDFILRTNHVSTQIEKFFTVLKLKKLTSLSDDTQWRWSKRRFDYFDWGGKVTR